MGVRSGSVVSGMKGVEIVEVEGPHPAANVGVQINHIKPVNKGEVVWTVNPADVIVIGRLFNKGVADFSRYGCYYRFRDYRERRTLKRFQVVRLRAWLTVKC